ncbi:hypothetical protein CDD83_3065 [Cordyceps sp. RAO-2017]|nr:hypothetical protein CDD83_3065 [Cordyceps sp. RAO-2017]
MSSLSQNAGLDAPVTVKVFYDGATRRAKMPLREMAPLTLEKHVRAFLHIPDDAKITIERFSDSAAAYVLLDPANVSVYKQLYRAAKAKSKLKLRVTVLATGERTVPKPASVEDVPDSSDGPAAAEPAVKLEAKPRAAALSRMEMPLRPSVSQPVQPASPPADASAKAPQEPREWHSDFRSRMKDIRKTTDDLAGLASQLERQLRVPSPAAPSPKAAAAAAGPPKLPLTLPASLARSCPATGCGFAVCCNHCEKTIPGAHYHCSTCDDGDFDLCPSAP